MEREHRPVALRRLTIPPALSTKERSPVVADGLVLLLDLDVLDLDVGFAADVYDESIETR